MPADVSFLGPECDWIKRCVDSVQLPADCKAWPVHHAPCECISPLASCMFETYKSLSSEQREKMYDQCGRTQFPFGVYMHYLEENQCELADKVNQQLDELNDKEVEGKLTYSCGWTIADGHKHNKNTFYTHMNSCMKSPGWPSKHVNYTDYVLEEGGEELVGMYVILDDDNAGINYNLYIKDAGDSNSQKGKLEPSQEAPSRHVCTNAAAPYLQHEECDNYPSGRVPTRYFGMELKHVIYIQNRNWVHSATVKHGFDPSCRNGDSAEGDHTYCTGKSVSWKMEDPPMFAVGGCKVNNCPSDNTFCCWGGGMPHNQTMCGENCFNCNDSCDNIDTGKATGNRLRQ